MSANIFHKLSGEKLFADSSSNLSPQTEALLHAIHLHSTDGPLAGVRLGAKEVFQRQIAAMGNRENIHVESLLCSLGALSGYACQAYLRAQAVARGMSSNAAFLVVDSADGKKFYFGDSLNRTLANSQYSVWSLAATAAQQAGAHEFPDLDELFEHTAEVLGSKEFGVPRVPYEHRAGDIPLNYLKSRWAPLFPVVRTFCPDPAHWPILYGMATQEAIILGKDAVDPVLALTIVMESAIAMSKVDLTNS